MEVEEEGEEVEIEEVVVLLGGGGTRMLIGNWMSMLKLCQLKRIELWLCSTLKYLVKREMRGRLKIHIPRLHLQTPRKQEWV
jgi:hypothetical protein